MNAERWIEFTTTDGTTGRVAVGEIEMVHKRLDLGAIHTVGGEVIHVVNVSTVLAQWIEHRTADAPADHPQTQER